uniref:Thioredoxin domain-containing protein n=1 Tax=Paulinella chromatophora TaxID=39717 RepID=B1X3P8_PAUCH|nr:hypothetical protein PCC_0115 [Paulinella chromatophora]ACB42567.1 hypothetical protein PCC_0115 [Paulinella chromatophora]
MVFSRSYLNYILDSIRRYRLMLIAVIVLTSTPVNAARTTNTYDGNIYALYAGNGSLIPPAISLSEALKSHRIVVMAFYLDDSAESKIFTPVLSELQRLWGRSIELIILPTDPLQWQDSTDPLQPAYYWRGRIPQILVIDNTGKILLDEEGQVPIELVNAAISDAAGRKPASDQSISRSISFNELNSELVFDH